MYKELYKKRVIVKRFVADDDSSIKAKLKWSNTDYKLNTGTTSAPKIINGNGNLVPRPNHGEVPRHMPEPSFVADPNHRRKTLAGVLYKFRDLGKLSPEEQRSNYDRLCKNRKKQGKEPPPPFKQKKWNLTLTGMDVRRLSKNFAFMARKLQYLDTDAAIVSAGKAVLEHHFDNHEHCGDWCKRKKDLEEQRQEAAAAAAAEATEGDKKKKKDRQFYRDKIKDKALYEKLAMLLARFLTLEALKEVAHQMDTCANESFNNTIAWLAPKNKVYSGTCSLNNRICIAIGISTLGMLHYFDTLIRKKLGIHINDDVRHFLSVKSNSRQKRLDKTKTKEYKRKRKTSEFEKIKRETVEATAARAKREGAVYQPGIGMTGGYDESDLVEIDDNDSGAKKPAAMTRKKTKTSPSQQVCTACNEPGHMRPWNKKCKLYAEYSQRKTQKAAPRAHDSTESVDMAEELAHLETLPIEDNDSGDSIEYFSACSEYS